MTVATKDRSAWKSVNIIILDQTVMKYATVPAEVAIKQQEYVTLGVILDGEDSFVKKNVLQVFLEKTVTKVVDIVYMRLKKRMSV